MDKATVVQKYADELAAIDDKIEFAMDTLHDALLGIGGSHSVKDLSAAIIKYQEEAQHIRICLDALQRERKES